MLWSWRNLSLMHQERIHLTSFSGQGPLQLLNCLVNHPLFPHQVLSARARYLQLVLEVYKKRRCPWHPNVKLAALVVSWNWEGCIGSSASIEPDLNVYPLSYQVQLASSSVTVKSGEVCLFAIAIRLMFSKLFAVTLFYFLISKATSTNG